MAKTLFWLARLSERLGQDPLPVIPYVGPVGNYLNDGPGSVLTIVFVMKGVLKSVRAGGMQRDIGANEAALINQRAGVRSTPSEGAHCWAFLMDLTHEPLFASLLNTPLFDVIGISHPERLIAALRNVAAWSDRKSVHPWNVMNRTPDLTLSVATASRRSIPLHRKAALYDLFAILTDEAEKRTVAPPASPVVMKAIEFLIAHYSDPDIDIPVVTRSVGLCPSHLWRIFKREVGTSPMRFLQQTRLRQGAAMLEQTSLRIGEIAAKVGFQDPLNFSRAFVTAFKCSPRAYRKQVNPPTTPARDEGTGRRRSRSD